MKCIAGNRVYIKDLIFSFIQNANENSQRFRLPDSSPTTNGIEPWAGSERSTSGIPGPWLLLKTTVIRSEGALSGF